MSVLVLPVFTSETDGRLNVVVMLMRNDVKLIIVAPKRRVRKIAEKKSRERHARPHILPVVTQS